MYFQLTKPQHDVNVGTNHLEQAKDIAICTGSKKVVEGDAPIVESIDENEEEEDDSIQEVLYKHKQI